MTTVIFRNLIEETHPIADNDDCISQIPNTNNELCKSSFETKAYNRCRDTNMRVAR